MSNEHTDLIAIPTERALEIFSAEKGLDPYLKIIRQEIDSFVPDMSTAKGRADIASMAHKVARSKTALDNIGKQLVADLKDVPRKIDAERKRMRDILDEWKAEVRRPLTEFEEAEAARILRHESSIANITALAEIPNDVIISSADITVRLEALDAVVIDDSFEEFEARAAREKQTAINALKVALTEAKEREEREAEAERRRKEAEEKARQEREEQIRKETLAEAEANRLRKIQAEKDEAERRARNIEHRRKINAAARDALVAAGLPENYAEIAIRAIAVGDVPAVSITY